MNTISNSSVDPNNIPNTIFNNLDKLRESNISLDKKARFVEQVFNHPLVHEAFPQVREFYKAAINLAIRNQQKNQNQETLSPSRVKQVEKEITFSQQDLEEALEKQEKAFTLYQKSVSEYEAGAEKNSGELITPLRTQQKPLKQDDLHNSDQIPLQNKKNQVSSLERKAPQEKRTPSHESEAKITQKLEHQKERVEKNLKKQQARREQEKENVDPTRARLLGGRGQIEKRKVV